MPHLRMMATDEGIDRFESVDETLCEQELEGTIDAWWRGAGAALLHAVEQVVRLDRLAGRSDQGQDLRAQWGQPQPARRASLLDGLDVGRGIVHVVHWIAAGIRGSRWPNMGMAGTRARSGRPQD